MLIEGFRESAPEAFPDLQTAIAEVRESFGADRITRVAVDDDGKAVGWMAGLATTKDVRGSFTLWSSGPINRDAESAARS